MLNSTENKLSPEQRQRERFRNKSAFIAGKYLRKMEELSGCPVAMQPFFDTLKDIYVRFKDAVHPPDVKTIGTYCMMVPQELILAVGAVNVKLCSGSYTAYSIGDDVTPRDSCPLIKAVAGFKSIGGVPLYENCSLMIVPVTCDCKKKLASMLMEYAQVHIMPIPSSREADDSIEKFLEELYALIPLLEETTGNKITYDSLTEAVRAVGYAQYQFSDFLKLKQANPPLIRGTHAMAVMNALSYMPMGVWASALEALNAELTQRKADGEHISRRTQPRIMITGSPVMFPNIKVPLLIDEMGGALVADETCMGDRFFYDPLAISDNSFDGIMRAMANRYIRPCTCPTFANSKQRIFRIKQMIKDNAIEGIIYHVLRGCLVYDFEYQMIEEELGKLDIPVIRVESDYNEEDVEQLRVRIEAFIELLKLRGQEHKEGNHNVWKIYDRA